MTSVVWRKIFDECSLVNEIVIASQWERKEYTCGEGGDNRQTEMLNRNMPPWHCISFMFTVKMCVIYIAVLLLVLMFQIIVNKLTMA